METWLAFESWRLTLAWTWAFRVFEVSVKSLSSALGSNEVGIEGRRGLFTVLLEKASPLRTPTWALQSLWSQDPRVSQPWFRHHCFTIIDFLRF